MHSLNVDDAVALIRMEYAEMPGLRLTFWQAQRLWNLSEELCEQALGALVRSGFLDRTAEGAYISDVSAQSGRGDSLAQAV